MAYRKHIAGENAHARTAGWRESRLTVAAAVACAAISCCSAAAPAAAQKRLPSKLFGFWDSADSACASLHSEGRLIISHDRLEYYETMCQVRSLSSAGKDAWTVRVRCVDDGGAASQTISLRLLADGKLTMQPSGSSYQRCERPPTQ